MLWLVDHLTQVRWWALSTQAAQPIDELSGPIENRRTGYLRRWAGRTAAWRLSETPPEARLFAPNCGVAWPRAPSTVLPQSSSSRSTLNISITASNAASSVSSFWITPSPSTVLTYSLCQLVGSKTEFVVLPGTRLHDRRSCSKAGTCHQPSDQSRTLTAAPTEMFNLAEWLSNDLQSSRVVKQR